MKLKHLLLSLSFVVGICSVAFAQQQQTALNVATTNPSEPMNFAGNEQARFVTNIANTATDGSGMFIDNIQLQIPEGFDLVSLSLVKNDSTLVSNTLSMQLNDTLRPSESYTLNYCIRVNCDAIPTNLSNQFSVFFSNNLQVHYTEHDTIKTFEERTNDYKLEVPSLSLTVGVGNANTHNNVKNIIWQTPVTDTFTIRNAAGAGSISNLRVAMLLMQNVDAFSDVKFSIVGGQFRNAEVEDGEYYIDFSSSDFQQVGLENTFDANEQLKVAVSFTPTKFYLQTQAKYLAQVKNGFEVCNEQTNASAICDYHCQEPNVTLNVVPKIIQKANYCGKEFICDVTFTNTSENTLTNTLKNASLRFGNWGYEITSVQYNGTELTATSHNTYYLPTTDIDGDGSPDFLPQESHTYRIKAILPTPTDNVSLWVDFRGESIDGQSLSKSAIISSSLTQRQYTIISPTDSKGGEPATYNISVDLTPRYYFQQYGFMDVEYIGIMYNNELVKEYPQGDLIKQSDDITITASCDIPQLFKLVVKTTGCDVIYTTDSLKGNSVMECPDTISHTSCIAVHTTEVSTISPQEINTCETFFINAIGELTYWCNDTCSKPRRIIARVYDLDGKVQFKSIAGSIFINGMVYDLQQSQENAVSNGIAWISDIVNFDCIDSYNTIPLQLTGEVFIKGNHNLPDMSNCNIRVEFAVEDMNGVVYNANSKGFPLTIYDPQVFVNNSKTGAFPARQTCNQIIEYGLRTTFAAPSVVNHPIKITHVDFPPVKGYYYTTPSEEGKPYSIDIESIGYYSKDGFEWAGFSQNVNSLCYTDGDVIEDLNGVVYYTDYYESCSEETIKTKDIASFSMYYAPIIEMNSSVEQSVSRLTTWNVFVKNTGNADAPNVTLRIKPNENNVTRLHIERILVNGIVFPSIEFPAQSGVFYVNIGDIFVNDNTPVKVSVTMSGCTGEGKSYLDVTAIWTCEDILTKENLAEEFELRNCNNFFTQLELQNMEAKLVAESLYTNEEYKLCQEIPIHLDVYNSGKAMLTDVGFLLDKKSFSEYVILENNELNTFYNGIEQKIINGIDVMNIIGNLSDTNSIISTQILKYNPLCIIIENKILSC